jgi:hypothetical protein
MAWRRLAGEAATAKMPHNYGLIICGRISDRRLLVHIRDDLWQRG